MGRVLPRFVPPRLTVIPGERASLNGGTEVALVHGYEVG